MEKYVEVKAAQEFADAFFGDPILKMAVNAVLDHAPTADVSAISSAEKQAIFRLGQIDMRDSIAALLTDLADGTRGVVCSTLVDATTRVRQLEIP